MGRENKILPEKSNIFVSQVISKRLETYRLSRFKIFTTDLAIVIRITPSDFYEWSELPHLIYRDDPNYPEFIFPEF